MRTDVKTFPIRQTLTSTADCGHCLVRVLGVCKISGKLRSASQNCEYGLSKERTNELAQDVNQMSSFVAEITR